MGWRETILKTVGPGNLAGATLGDWLRILRDQRFRVTPSRVPRALSITAHSAVNSAFRRLEELRFGRRIDAASVPPPVFVLGHWRSGTTHLHNLLAVDRRFGFPDTFQVFFPHTFLTSGAFGRRVVGFFMTRRRPMDDVAWTVASPQEDEFALLAMSRVSPFLGWMFPRSRERYRSHLTLRGVRADELERWRASFHRFLKKLAVLDGRPLILKSPPHTGRIRVLLEMFPGARFVHIQRDPFAVFASMRHLMETNHIWAGLEPAPSSAELVEWIIGQYREMYEAYFEDLSRVPAGQRCEVRFEDLESDPIGQVAAIYRALGLPDFEVARPDLERYVASLAGYRKNDHPLPPDALRRRLAEEWRICFEAWGYPTGGASAGQKPRLPPSSSPLVR